MLDSEFFSQDPCRVAKQLLGKVIRHCYQGHWLSARIIETEAYYCEDKASHSSLGYTEKRKAMFMPAGTIYMYYARGADSLNVSCGKPGDAVLIKSAFPVYDAHSDKNSLAIMQQLNPATNGEPRPVEKLCAGQTLLCKSLNIKVKQWDQQQFDQHKFFIEDDGYCVEKIIQTKRLGIHPDRHAELMYRFIDFAQAKNCTQNPLSQRSFIKDIDYKIIKD